MGYRCGEAAGRDTFQMEWPVGGSTADRKGLECKPRNSAKAVGLEGGRGNEGWREGGRYSREEQ